MGDIWLFIWFWDVNAYVGARYFLPSTGPFWAIYRFLLLQRLSRGRLEQESICLSAMSGPWAVSLILLLIFRWLDSLSGRIKILAVDARVYLLIIAFQYWFRRVFVWYIALGWVWKVICLQSGRKLTGSLLWITTRLLVWDLLIRVIVDWLVLLILKQARVVSWRTS